jgi:hypothetical protein
MPVDKLAFGVDILFIKIVVFLLTESSEALP